MHKNPYYLKFDNINMLAILTYMQLKNVSKSKKKKIDANTTNRNDFKNTFFRKVNVVDLDDK